MARIIICLVLSLLFIIGFSCGINAAGDDVDISFKVGDDFFNINGKSIQAEKAVIINNVTLVPIRIISEAFGSTVKWNDVDRSIEINSGARTIKLFVGKKEANIDTEKIELLMEPIISNGRTMVPIRFISENLGADVSFVGETKEVKVSKSFVKSNSVRDYSAVLKKSNKKQIGDSENFWKINVPTDMKMVQRNFNGAKTLFSSKDNNTALKINILNKENETLDYILNKILNDRKDYQILKQGVENNGRFDYVRVIMKNAESLCEERDIIANGKIYSVVYVTNQGDNYLQNTQIKDFLDSFDVYYKANDVSVEDLSDLRGDGFRKYRDKKYKWSIDIPGDWLEVKDDSLENKVRFVYSKETSVEIDMFSIDEGDTISKVVQNEINYINERCNPQRFKILNTKTNYINGNALYTMISEFKPNQESIFLYEVFGVGKRYKFHLTANIAGNLYRDTVQLDKIRKMMDSFEFAEPDNTVAETFVYADNKIKPVKYRSLSNVENNWKMELPVNWVPTKESDERSTFTYHDENYRLSISFTANKTINMSDYLKYYEGDFMKKMASLQNYRNISKETIDRRGVKVIKYTSELVVSGALVKEYYYVLTKNNIMYTFSEVIRDINNTPKNMEILQHIWDSFEV